MLQTMALYNNKKEIEKAIGLDKLRFLAKIKAMQEKWKTLSKKDEYEETRIISPYLFNKTKRTPVNTSILSDNLEYFRENYVKEYSDHNLIELLEVACLSGSKGVAEFLLGKLEKTYSSKDCQFVLNYAAASFNISWVKEIAEIMSKQGIMIPNHIYSSMNSDEMIKEVIKVFEANSGGNRPVLAF